MKSKTQDKKRLNAVGMRICALFAVLAVVFAAFMTTVPHALASETGNPASVKGKTYKIGTDTTFAPFEYRGERQDDRHRHGANPRHRQGRGL